MAFSLTPLVNSKLGDGLAQLIENFRVQQNGEPTFWGASGSLFSIPQSSWGLSLGDATPRAVFQHGGAGTGDAVMASNARYTGAAWARFSTTRPSWMMTVSESGDYLDISRTASGSGSITWTNLLRVDNTGRVGIGGAPSNLFDVRGPNAQFLTVANTGLTEWLGLYNGGAGDQPAVIFPAGRSLRIGTTSSHTGSTFTEYVRINSTFLRAGIGVRLTKTRVVTTNTALDGTDCVVYVRADGLTLTLPDASDNPQQVLIIIFDNVNGGTLSAAAGDNIQGAATKVGITSGGAGYRMHVCMNDGTSRWYSVFSA